MYFLLKSLSHVHHANFWILFLLQRNQDVDSVVLEDLLCSTRVPNISRFEFFPLLLQYRSGLPVQVHHTGQSAPQSTQYLTKTCGICHPCAIFPKWFGNLHAWVGELSAASPWPCRAFVAARKLHVWHHVWGSFWWRNLELIRRRSSLSNCMVLREGFRLLPHEQYTMPISQCKAQSEHCFLEEVSQRSKISVLPMSVTNFFDFSFERVNFLRLTQVLQAKLLVGVILKLLNQLFDCFSTIRVLLLDCRMRYAWDSTIQRSRCWFPVTSRYALVVRGFSCFLIRLILLSTLRIRLQYNTR